MSDTKDTTPKVITLAATNPSKEEMAAICVAVSESFSSPVVAQPVTFNFKKSIDKDTGITTLRESVDLAIPTLTAESIVAILEAGDKQLELLLEVANRAVTDHARTILIADDKGELTADTFPVDKLAWEVIAAIPKGTRTGGGIPKETWEAFGIDYVSVMPTATGKTVEQVSGAAKLLAGKLQGCKTNKPVLQLLVTQLAIYAEASAQIEEFSDCVSFLLEKADTFLNQSEEELLANL